MSELLESLACPSCAGTLESSGASARCARCGQLFYCKNGLWDLVPRELREGVEGDARGDWARWREAMDGLDRWRARRQQRGRLGLSTSDGTEVARTRAFLASALAPGLVVDVGAKDGSAQAWMPEGVRYLGVDPRPGAPAAGFSGLLVRGLGEALPVATGAAAGLCCLAALDYLVELEGAVREFARVLEPRGRLAVLVSVLSPAVAKARAARGAARLGAVWGARGEVGLGAAASMLVEAPAHASYLTRERVLSALSERFALEVADAVRQRASEVLYVRGWRY